MAINLKTTSGLTENGVKILAYGEAGAGKTRLIPTLPNPIAISVEGGLLSIQSDDVPYLEVTTFEELVEAFKWLKGSDEAQAFDSVSLDSISELGEVILSHEKANTKDPRQAYGAMNDKLSGIIRGFRDLPKHIYMTAKLDRVPDETGTLLHAPSAPGKSTAAALPYLFDEVFAIRTSKTEDGAISRVIQTSGDGVWSAKDRSGRLEMWTPYELGLGGVIDLIRGAK